MQSTGLKVIAVMANGANPNRKLFKVDGDGDYTKPKMSMPLMKDLYTSYLIHPTYCLSHSHVNSHSTSLRVSHRIKYLHVLDCLCCALHKLQCSCPLAKDIYGVW